jgi:hypothetical protein
MDLDRKGIDYTTLKKFNDKIMDELSSRSPEVRVKKLH